MGLVGSVQVVGEQVARAGGEGQDGDSRVGKGVRYSGNRAVSARNHDRVEPHGVAHQIGYVGRSVGEADAMLVAIAGDHANVVVNGAISVTR